MSDPELKNALDAFSPEVIEVSPDGPELDDGLDAFPSELTIFEVVAADSPQAQAKTSSASEPTLRNPRMIAPRATARLASKAVQLAAFVLFCAAGAVVGFVFRRSQIPDLPATELSQRSREQPTEAIGISGTPPSDPAADIGGTATLFKPSSDLALGGRPLDLPVQVVTELNTRPVASKSRPSQPGTAAVARSSVAAVGLAPVATVTPQAVSDSGVTGAVSPATVERRVTVAAPPIAAPPIAAPPIAAPPIAENALRSSSPESTARITASPPEGAPPSTAVRAPTAPSAGVRPVASETSAIQSVLGQYRGAFSDLSSDAAAAVWPSVDVRALDRAFSQVSEQEFSFDACQISVTGANATASCTGQARYVPKVGNRNPRSEARRWDFTLGKISDQWIIASVRSRSP